MKKILLVFLTLGLLSLFPYISYAQENSISEENCIDLEEIYQEINRSSKAVTGVDNSIDAVKKINTTASLLNIVTLFLGDQIYCIKDEQAAAQSKSLGSIGLLGMVDNGNKMLAGIYPDINVANHLAEMFVPGYEDKNSLLAQSSDPATDPDPVGGTDKEKKANEEAQGIKNKIEDGIDSSVNEFFKQTEIKVQEYPEVTNTRISGYDYLKDVVHLDRIWKHSLNIVYVLFVLVFIVVGFMIMFRKNLQGNVTVTVSRALPRIIVSLILATFSFAIVGMIMNIGRMSIDVSRSVFSNIYQEMGEDDASIIEQKNVWNMADEVFKKTRKNTDFGDFLKKKIPIVGESLAKILVGDGNSIGEELARVGGMGIGYYFLDRTMPDIVKEADPQGDLEITGSLFFVEATFEILQPIIDAVMFVIKNALFIGMTVGKIGLMTAIIKSLVLIVISFYAAFKLFITLLTTYLKLFVNVIIAPFQILLGAVPGNTHQITNWFKSVVANSLVFAGVFVVINAFSLIAKSIDTSKFNFFGNGGVLWPDIIISLESIIVIAGYLFAASLPKIINGALGVETNKSMLSASEDVKQSVKKIPLVGGMFN